MTKNALTDRECGEGQNYVPDREGRDRQNAVRCREVVTDRVL